MDTEKYNGWTNYETWNVALWIDNDPAMYHYVTEELCRDNETVGDLSRSIETLIRENEPDLGASTYSDLLTHALGRVSWYEIAAHFEEDIEKHHKLED